MQLLVLSFGMLVACGGNQTATVDAPTRLDSSGPAPSLVVTLTPDTIAPGGTLTATIATQNFTIVDPRTGPPVKDGEGHYHYYVDDDTEYTAGWTTTVSIRTAPSLAAGTHHVRFVLATSAHQEVTPLVETVPMFTVQ